MTVAVVNGSPKSRVIASFDWNKLAKLSSGAPSALAASGTSTSEMTVPFPVHILGIILISEGLLLPISKATLLLLSAIV